MGNSYHMVKSPFKLLWYIYFTRHVAISFWTVENWMFSAIAQVASKKRPRFHLLCKKTWNNWNLKQKNQGSIRRISPNVISLRKKLLKVINMKKRLKVSPQSRKVQRLFSFKKKVFINHIFFSFSIQRSMTVCCYHVAYAFQSEHRLYSCLNVKEPFARNRHDIWRLSDNSGIRDMIIAYSRMHHTDKDSQHSSVNWPVWLNS